MIFWLSSLVWAEIFCPQTDLYAKELDAYTIVIDDIPVSLHFQLDFAGGAQARDTWRALLRACGRNEAEQAFEDFVSATKSLSALGFQWQSLDWWRRKQHWILRKKIAEQEKIVARSYVHFLRILQQETGIAVRWKPKSHPLVKGMVSTARGSDLIADYVAIVWRLEERKEY